MTDDDTDIFGNSFDVLNVCTHADVPSDKFIVITSSLPHSTVRTDTEEHATILFDALVAAGFRVTKANETDLRVSKT